MTPDLIGGVLGAVMVITAAVFLALTIKAFREQKKQDAALLACLNHLKTGGEPLLERAMKQIQEVENLKRRNAGDQKQPEQDAL